MARSRRAPGTGRAGARGDGRRLRGGQAGARSARVTWRRATTSTTCRPGAFYHDFVQFLVDNGITAGCGPGQFCGEQAVTRGQTAVFLKRLFDGWSTGCPPDSVKVGDGLRRQVRGERVGGAGGQRRADPEDQAGDGDAGRAAGGSGPAGSHDRRLRGGLPRHGERLHEPLRGVDRRGGAGAVPDLVPGRGGGAELRRSGCRRTPSGRRRRWGRRTAPVCRPQRGSPGILPAPSRAACRTSACSTWSATSPSGWPTGCR